MIIRLFCNMLYWVFKITSRKVRKMTRQLPYLVVVSLLAALTSCAPVKQGSYFYPSYEGGKSRVLRRDCCGGAGPEEVLTIDGPESTKYIVILKALEKSSEVRVGVYLPEGVGLELKGLEILVTIQSANQPLAYRIEAVNEWMLGSLNPGCLNVIGRLKADRSSKDLSKRFEGKGKKGTIVWFAIFLPGPAPEKFTIVLPAVSINGERLAPLPIDFHQRDPDTYIYPLNC